MNQDSEFTDDPRDGAASESDPVVLNELERRLREMRPVTPDIDLTALVERAHEPDGPIERANEGDANWLPRQKSAGEVIEVRRTRRFLPVAAAWLCGVAMGAVAMIAVQKNTLPIADADGTTEVRKAIHGDARPAPHHDQGMPKSAERIAVDQVKRSRELPAVVGAAQGRDLASMLDALRPEYGRGGDIWWTGMLMREGIDPFGPPWNGGPPAAVATMEGGADESNPSGYEVPTRADRPAPTRERLFRELQHDRSGRVF